MSSPHHHRFLRNHRNRPVRAPAVARACSALLRELGELIAAVGRDFADPRWSELGAAVEACARELRRLG